MSRAARAACCARRSSPRAVAEIFGRSIRMAHSHQTATRMWCSASVASRTTRGISVSSAPTRSADWISWRLGSLRQRRRTALSSMLPSSPPSPPETKKWPSRSNHPSCPWSGRRQRTSSQPNPCMAIRAAAARARRMNRILLGGEAGPQDHHRRPRPAMNNLTNRQRMTTHKTGRLTYRRLRRRQSSFTASSLVTVTKIASLCVVMITIKTSLTTSGKLVPNTFHHLLLSTINPHYEETI